MRKAGRGILERHAARQAKTLVQRYVRSHAHAADGDAGRGVVDDGYRFEADRRLVNMQDALGAKIITETKRGCGHLTAPMGRDVLLGCSSSLAICSRNMNFWTLPVTVIGNSSTKRT